MRIDKYLKVSRIIKRRTVANEACAGGTDVKPGDMITIRFGEHLGRYEILAISETVRKDQASEMYRVIEEDDGMNTERNQA